MGGADFDDTIVNGTETSLGMMSSVTPEIHEEHITREPNTMICSSGRGDSTHQIFEAYISHEARKLQQSPGAYMEHYSHMELYQKALSNIATQKHSAIASLALAIGDCSAMILLKQATQSVRSPTVDCWVRIGRDMFLEKRLEAIYHLDLRMAHLWIARWLHIYKLYEELFGSVGGRGVDDFVVLTSVDQDQTLAECRTSVRRGNLRNIEKASITRRMAKQVGNTNGRAGDRFTTNKSLNRLRRIGARLQLFINQWGLGTLCLLGTRFTDNLYHLLLMIELRKIPVLTKNQIDADPRCFLSPIYQCC